MNLSNHISEQEIISRKDSFKRIFFFRICGTGMGAAASLLKEQGFEVFGCDQNFYPPMSDYLVAQNIELINNGNITPERLRAFDLIVVGNVIPRGSEHARIIEDSGVPFCSFPAILGALILKDINVVGIAGTHGKTTTTYLISQLFTNLGENPGHFIGGVLGEELPSKLGDGKYFFIESDEYDSAYFEKFSKFRSYQLNHLILTSLEFDHADIFANIDEIKEQFIPLQDTIDGQLIITTDYPAANDIHQKFVTDSKRPALRYGVSSKTGPMAIKSDRNGTTFTLKLDNEEVGFNTNLIGNHNVLNLSAAILFAYQEGFSIDKIQGAITDLKLVKRRQELKGFFHGSPVIDDFAHHPTAVKPTINALKARYPDHSIVTILEPASATARSNIFQDRWAGVLSGSEQIILIDPQKKSTAQKNGDLDFEKLRDDLTNQDIPATIVTTLSEVQSTLRNLASGNRLLLFLSNGPCLGLWSSDFVDELQ